MKKDRGGNVKERETDTEKNGENSRLKKHSTHTHTHTHKYMMSRMFNYSKPTIQTQQHL
jgi:hypothetical protein